MTEGEFKGLKRGDTVRHYMSEEIWLVSMILPTGQVVLTRYVSVGTEQKGEWNKVPRPRSAINKGD